MRLKSMLLPAFVLLLLTDIALAACSATGGSMAESSGYCIHTFTSGTSTFTPSTSMNVELLVVAGGASSGASAYGYGGAGGGGAGGLIYQASYAVTPQDYSVRVGSGGTAPTAGSGLRGNNGEDSVFGALTAVGGGGGGCGYNGGGGESPHGKSGGSGGGGAYYNYAYTTIASGTAGQGNSGGQNGATTGAGGGGGGGAGGAGSAPTNSPRHNGGLGGPGATYSISGTSVTYAAGGKGGAYESQAGSNAAANTGNGGNSGYANNVAGAGGSGIVIIKYAASAPACACGTITQSCTMNSDLSSAGTCLTVGAASVTIDCNGFKITGANASSTYGVYSNQAGTVVKNCNISNFERAVYFEGVLSGSIQNTIANSTYSSGAGVYLWGTNSSTFNRITARSIQAYISNNNTFGNFTVADPGYMYPLHLSSSNSNTLYNFTAYSLGTDAVYLVSSSYNRLYNFTSYSGTTLQNSAGLHMKARSDYNNVTNFTVTNGGILIDFETGGQVPNRNNLTNFYVRRSDTFYSMYLSAAVNSFLSNFTVNGTGNSWGGLSISTNSENLTIHNFTVSNSFGADSIHASNIYDFRSEVVQIGSAVGESRYTYVHDFVATGTASFQYSVAAENFTASSTSSSSAVALGYQGAKASNFTATCTGTCPAALQIGAFSNVRASNFTATANPNLAISISSGGNVYLDNFFANSTSTTSGTYGLGGAVSALLVAPNLSLSNGTIISSNPNANTSVLWIQALKGQTGYSGGEISNITFISANKNQDLVTIYYNTDNLKFYHNNFSETSGMYFNDTAGTNYLSTTIGGIGAGNIYHNVISGAVQISGSANMSPFPGLFYGNGGTGYPYSSATSGGKITSNLVDNAPLTTNAPPGALFDCGIISTPGTYTLARHLTAISGTCLNVTANDVTINGGGWGIFGDGSTGVGIASSASRTTVSSCSIFDFSVGAQIYNPFGILNGGIIRDSTLSNVDKDVEIVATNTTLSNLQLTGEAGNGFSLSMVIHGANRVSGITAKRPIVLQLSSNNSFNNITVLADSSIYAGITLLSGSNGNNFTNFNITTIGSGGALGGASSADNNRFSNGTLKSIASPVATIRGIGDEMSNVTFISNQATGTLLQNEGYNGIFYWNNFTYTSGLYINDIGSGNRYNGPAVASTPPIAYWKFNEGTGSTAIDSSGNGKTGTLANAGWWNNGAYSNFVGCTASNSLITLSSGVNIGSDWTASVWSQFPLVNSGSWRTLFRGASYDHQVIVDSSGNLGMYDNAGGTGFHSSGYNINGLSSGWHHLAAVGSGTSTSFYIDGTYVGQADKKSTDPINYICNYQGAGQAWGYIDDLRIYNYAMSANQVYHEYIGDGNIYQNVVAKQVEANGFITSVPFPSLYIGAAGAAVPYTASSSGGKVSSGVSDSAPLTPYQANTAPWTDGVSLTMTQWYPIPSGTFYYTHHDNEQSTLSSIIACYRNGVEHFTASGTGAINNVPQTTSGTMFGFTGTATNDAVYCCAQANDSIVWGTTVCSNTLTAPAQNTPPVISSITYSPFPVYASFYCGVTATDAQQTGSDELTLEIRTYKNGALQNTYIQINATSGQTWYTSPANFSNGDTFACEGRAYDGTYWSNWTMGSTVSPTFYSSCKAIKDANPASGDGIYWIDPDAAGSNPSFQAYCDQTYDGGGWTLLMKATTGTTFNYDANYWTTSNTLNPTDVTRDNADAKYRSFNELNITSVMARWPDAGDIRWKKADAWASAPALTGFNTFHNWGTPQEQSDWNSTYFSSEPVQCEALTQGGPGMYGTKLADLGGINAGSRWGYRFNENGCGDWGSDDAGGGIGLRAAGSIGPLASTGGSAGDSTSGCCGPVGMNRLARVEVYGREGYVGTVTATPTMASSICAESLSSYVCDGAYAQGLGTQNLTAQIELYRNGGLVVSTGTTFLGNNSYGLNLGGYISSASAGDTISCRVRGTTPTGGDSGWQSTSGTAVSCNSGPSTGTISPSSGTYYSSENPVVAFTTTYSDPDGWNNIQYVRLLINYGIDGGNSAFYGYYNINNNHAYIINDAGDTWIDAGAIGSLSETCNTYACIEPSTSHSGSGNTLTVTWHVKMRNGWHEPAANMYLYVVDDASASDGWDQYGQISIINYGNGVACSANNQCSSSNCRKEIDSGSYYCAGSGNACSENLGGHAGYAVGAVGTNSNSDWQCIAASSSAQCHSGTVCATYNNLYCNGVNAWASGTGSGVSVANCNAYTCNGQTIQRYACNGAGSCTAQGSIATCAGTTCNYCTNGASSCTLPGTGTLCRASAGDCDPPDYCDGAGSCASDGKCGSGYKYVSGTTCSAGSCRPSAGTCDLAEECNGVVSSCPADSKVSSSTLCSGSTTWSASNGACQATRTYNNCDGVNNACPTNNPGAQTQYASSNGQVWWSGAWTAATCSQYCSMTGANGCSGQQTTTTPYGCASGSNSCSYSVGACGTGTYCQGTDANCGCSGGSCTNCAASGYVCSSYSCVVPVVTPTTPTVAPLYNQSLVSQYGGFNISWGANGNSAGTIYGVYESTTSTLLAAGTSTSYIRTGLADNTRYCYKVNATYNGQSAAYTSEVCAITPDRTSPAVPTLLPGKRGLVGYWSFDEGSGSYAYDSAYGNKGTLDLASGSGWLAAGKVNGALYLNQGDGGSTASDVVVVPDSDLIDIDVSKSFTISLWVNPMPYVCTAIMRKDSQFELYRCANAGGGITIRLWLPAQTEYTGSIAIADNQWSQLVITYDKPTSSLKMYVNNVSAGTWTVSGTPAATTSSLGIGAYPNGIYSFKGVIDEVKLYNRALSATEVSEEYTPARAYLTATDGDSGLQLYMPFEEGVGSATSDWSPNTNDGALTGTSWATGNSGNGYALSFNGASSKVTVTNSSSINAGTSSITMSAWVKLNGCTGANALIHKNLQYTFAVYSDSSLCKLTYADSSLWSYSSFGYHGAVGLGAWHHVAVTKSASNIVTIYLDGISVVSKSFGSSISSTNNPLTIGSYSSPSENYFVNGLIDEVRIYNRALTAREIVNDMQSGLVSKGIYKSSSVSGTYSPANGSFYDFQSGNANGWTAGRGTWSVGAYGGHSYAYIQSSTSSNPLESITGSALSNYVVESEIYTPTAASSHPGIIFHALDTNNYNLVYLRPHSSGTEAAVQCAYVTSGTLSATTTAVATIPWNTWFNVKLVVNDAGTAKVYVNDVYATTCANSRGYSSGKAGVWEHGAAAGFDNFKVTNLQPAPGYTDPNTADTAAPSNSAAPLVSASSATSAYINWGTTTPIGFVYYFPDIGNTYYYNAQAFDSSGNWESLAANPGFERASESWSTAAYASIATTPNTYDGTGALSIGYNGGAWAGISQCKSYGSYELGTWYRAEVKYKCTSGSSQIFFGDAVNYGIYATSTTAACTGNWETLSIPLFMAATQPSNGNFCIYVYGNNAPSGVYYDDVKWYKVKNETVTSGTKDYYIGGSGTGANQWYTASGVSISGLTPNTLYCYTIKPRDHAGNEGSTSAGTCVTTPPAAPSGLSATALSNQALNSHLGAISVTWSTNGNPAGTNYDVFINSGSWSTGPYNGAITLSGGSIVDNTQYCVKVRATGTGGTTGFSNEQCVTTIDRSAPTPDPATIASVTPNSYSQITVTATTATEPHSAPAQYNISRVSPYASTGWQASPTWVDTGLTGSTQYCYRVQYKDALGNTGSLSSQSCGTTLNAPPTCTVTCTPSGVYTCASPCSADSVSCSMQGNDTESSSLTYTFETKMNGVTTTGGTSSGSLANGGWIYYGGTPYISPVQTGSFTMVFNVTDGNSQKTSCISNTVSVTARPDTCPTVTSAYITPGSLLPNQGFNLRAVAVDNDGYQQAVNYYWTLKKNTAGVETGTKSSQVSGADVVLATVPDAYIGLPLTVGDTYSCTVQAYDGTSCTTANAPSTNCGNYVVGTNGAPTLTSISLAPACIKTGTVTVSTVGFGDPNGDTTYLQVGTSSAGTNICNVAASSCTFQAESFYGGTGVNTVHARAYDGTSASPGVTGTLNTDNAGPSTVANAFVTVVSSSRLDVSAQAPGLISDAGCAGLGDTPYQFTRNGVPLGWQASYSWSDTGLSPHTVYCYTSQYRDAFGNVGAASSPSTCAMTGNNAPDFTAIGYSPSCAKAGTTVTADTQAASDPDGDTLALQIGSASGQSDLCTSSLGSPERSCTFTVGWSDTGSHTLYGRVVDGYGGISREANTGAGFRTDNSGPATVAQVASATPVGTSQINVAAPASGISDNGCAGMGTLTYNFSRVGGSSSGWQASNTWAATGLSPHTQYCFTVQYQDAFGNAGAASAQVCNNTTNTAPTTPTNINPNGGQSFVGAASNSITISWTASTDSDGDAITYTVEYSANSGSTWNVIGSTASTSYAWNSAGVASGSAYRVRVKASDAYNGVSAYVTSASDFTITHNTAPTIADIAITPSIPYTSDNINCSIRPVDGEQALVNASIQWYKNGALMPLLNSTFNNVANNTLTRVATLGFGNLTAGDSWYCKVNVSDGTVASGWSQSSAVTVLQGCGVLSSAGATYSLTTDLTITSTCFNVTGSNIEIHCNGKTLTGSNAAGVFGVYSSAPGTKVHNCTFVNFVNAINLNGASGALIYNNTFVSATGTHLNVSATSGSNNIYFNYFGATSGAYVSDLNGGNYYNTSVSGHGEGNLYANVLDGSRAIFGSTPAVTFPAYNIGSSGGDYPYKLATSGGKFACNFANCADYAPFINKILVAYTCRISPDAPYASDTLQGFAGAPNSSNNVTYYYKWYMNSSLNCTGDEASVHVG